MAKETKPERIARLVAEAVGAGQAWFLDSVDFSDPARPKTCLEVDFPILPINHVAAIEGNAGKPIYQMSKWWARRRSSVFRAMLIAAAAKAPDDPGEAAKLVWDAYYGNHQKNPAFAKLKVADIFMGGGTTVVEGARLGMQMYGNDLNPVAWFVVKNELARVDAVDVKKLLAHVEAEVKPQIMPFYACDCPRGHKGKWKKKGTGEVMGAGFDPLKLTPAERPGYEYEGPEVIYTFWAKHGPCQATGCGHRTPIMSSLVMAVKTLTVKAWADKECMHCNAAFDIEQRPARMAPAALYFLSPEEKRHAVMDEFGRYKCPYCGQSFQEPVAARTGESVALGKAKNKSVALTLLVHPDWLKGSPSGNDTLVFGGSAQDSAHATAAWNTERAKKQKLIEVRGPLPEQIACPDTGEVFYTDEQGGTVPRKSTFTCMAPTCGKQWDVLESIKRTKKTGPVAMYAVQGYCPECDKKALPYSGRFFAVPDVARFDAAHREWEARQNTDLAAFWPRSELPYGFMTHMNNGGIPNHGFTHWWTMFNFRQLLVLTQLLKAVSGAVQWDAITREFVLGAYQQYLRNQNMFYIWDRDYDKLVPHMSNNNYHPKSTMVENSVFPELGRGNWASSVANVQEGKGWQSDPWDLVSVKELEKLNGLVAEEITGKSAKTTPGDPILSSAVLDCRSSSDLSNLPNGSYDLVITDPPFGGLLHYSELADFFYVWLRLALKDTYPNLFQRNINGQLPETPKVLEAVSNRARHPDDPDAFYQRILTECWREAARILKPGGLMAFTFHHSEDEPWVAVLESLFEAGFYLEATYPIRSDETKGEGGKPGTFGSQRIEYDIIHVCRKQTETPSEVSWARLRRQITQDVKQLQEILEQHQNAGLQVADLQVIRRGKALEYYSRHYGKVYVERGREFKVREALLAINQLLDEQTDASTEAAPVLAEAYTRQFLRLFADKTSLPRDQMSKYLRGTGVAPSEFIERGWCVEKNKTFTPVSPLQLALAWKGVSRLSMTRDFDQAMFMVGACFEGSGIKMSDTLDNPSFSPHPAVGDVLDWLTCHGGTNTIKSAARTASQLYRGWVAKNQRKVVEQRTLFDLLDEGA